MRRILSACLFVLAAPVSAAHAAPTCNFSGGTLAVDGGQPQPGESHQLQLVLENDGTFKVNDMQCSGGGTAANTTKITVKANGHLEVIERLAVAPIPMTVEGGSHLEYADETGRGTHYTTGLQGPVGVSYQRRIDRDGDGVADIISAHGFSSSTAVRLGAGDDTLSASGLPGDSPDSQTGAGVRPLFYGGAGNDRFLGPARFVGGPGDDVYEISTREHPGAAFGSSVIYWEAPGPVTMREDATATLPGADGDGGTDTFRSSGTPGSLSGSQFSDVLYAGPHFDVVNGNAGDDRLTAGSGATGLFGDAGADVLTGGPGNDHLRAGPFFGPDTAAGVIDGGAGSDTIFDSGLGDLLLADDGVADQLNCSGLQNSGARDRLDTVNGSSCPPVPTVSITGGSAVQGTAATFTVTLSSAAQGPATVAFSTADGSAKSPADYAGTAQTVTIPAGQTSVTVPVATVRHRDSHPTRDFTGTLSDPSVHANLGDPATASATITDFPDFPDPPDPPDPADPVLCGKPIVLLDVQAVRRKVRIAGLALASYAGQRVVVSASGKNVGQATVGSDGSFETSVPAPSRRARRTVRYQATVGTARSRALKLERDLIISKRAGTLLTGRVVAPKRLLPKKVTFYRQLDCRQTKKFGTARVRRNGSFKVRLAGPTPPDRYALYRVIAAIGGGKSYTLPIAVR